MADDHLLDYVPGFSSTSHQKRVSGPCPWCGGEDRFVVFTSQGEYDKGSFHCFNNPGKGCGRGGDAIQFLRDYHEMSYPEAVKALGLEEEKLDGKSKEQRRIEQEKQAPDAALRVKKWNIVRQRIAAREAERQRRKRSKKRKLKRRHRQKIAKGMDEAERYLLRQTKTYRRTRRMHRAIARFVTLHAQKSDQIGSAATPTKSPMEVLNQPSRFEQVTEIYKAFRHGLAEGLQTAPLLDEEETKNLQKKLLKLTAKAQYERGELTREDVKYAFMDIE